MSSKAKKEIREWIILIVVGGFIYLMGWHTVIASKIQQAVLSTGIISPSELKEEKYASYDFVLEDVHGQRFSFSDFEGKTIFINFWATWCPPCIAEMPDIHDLYQSTKEGVEFVMISVDQDEQKAKRFADDRSFNFPIYFLRSALPSVYQTQSIPTTYLIDKNGRVWIENSGMAKYNTSSFKELLAEIE
jgi:thiol-disulfide isomerase/thioredoxin